MAGPRESPTPGAFSCPPAGRTRLIRVAPRRRAGVSAWASAVNRADVLTKQVVGVVCWVYIKHADVSTPSLVSLVIVRWGVPELGSSDAERRPPRGADPQALPIHLEGGVSSTGHLCDVRLGNAIRGLWGQP